MKRAFLLIVALLLTACSSGELELTTFGLTVASFRDGHLLGAFCSVGGSTTGGASASQLDGKIVFGGAPKPPNLWVEHEAVGAAEETAYEVRVYIANGYDEIEKVPTSRKSLVKRLYDGDFGKTRGTDTIHVDFEGAGYDITITGVPGKSFNCSLPTSDRAPEGG